MGKNKSNSFIPPKGKPSGSGREGSGLRDVNDVEKDNELAENYTKAEDVPADNVHVRHPNRNTDKGREDQG